MIAKHEQSSDETREWTSLYALGAMTPEEKSDFEEHRKRCLICESDVRALEEVSGQLGFAADPANPPASLRVGLLEGISETPGVAEPDRPASDMLAPSVGVLLNAGGLLISRSTAMKWEAGGLPGISSKVLFNDPVRDYTTQLVRMEPKTTYPSHHHKDVEELYLLEGDLLVEGQLMRAGDYCRADPDSIHGEVSTESGALFLVLSSTRDELLA